jgi:hypothetical protein
MYMTVRMPSSQRARPPGLDGPRSAVFALVAGALLVALPARADDIVDDPELAAVPHETLRTPPPPNGPRETTWRTTLRTRWGVDTDWTRPSQDIVTGTSIAVVEAEQRRSDSLLLSVGLRARHGYAAHRNGDDQFELDVAPVSAFADVTVAPGYHLRAGYQVIGMGRFDMLTATNFLTVYDLRSGPVTMPEASAIAQPALRFDFDKIRGFALQAYYVPFFEPHLIAAYGSDYSLLSAVERQFGANSDATRSVLERALGRSGLTSTSTAALRALAPVPDLRSPQGALRATFYGSVGELSATVGAALEPLPTLVASPALAAFLASPGTSQAQRDALLDQPIRAEHLRYGIAALDAALDAGPFQLGAEAAYMRKRTLLGTRPGSGTTTTAAAVPEQVDMTQFGLRAEMVQSRGFAAEVETYFTVALRNPTDPTLLWLGMDGRYSYGVAAGAHYSPDDSGLRFELGGAAISVATLIVMPRIEWEFVRTFFAELGAVFIQGSKPGALGTPNVSFGGLYRDMTQVFAGLRWSP